MNGQPTPTLSHEFHSDPSSQIGCSQESPTPFVVEDDLEFIFAPDGSLWRAIAGFAGWKLDDPAEGEDIAQETCLRVLRAIRHGKELERPDPGAGRKDRFRKYSFKIARNLIREAWAKRSHMPLSGLPDDDYLPADPEHAADAAAADRQRRERVKQALERLPERERLVITLRSQGHRDDKIVKHLAAATGKVLTENHVRQIRYRVLRTLSAMIEEPTPSPAS